MTNVVSAGGPLDVTNYAFGYDLAGNCTLAETNAAQDQFQYNSLNQLISVTAGPTNSATYEWDAAERLVAINEGTHRSEFSYDGLGHRARIVEKENGLVVADNYFLWCGNTLCEEWDVTGGTVVRRFFRQGESIVQAATTNIFYTRDHLGSIREALDSAGTIQARYDYDPFGQQAALSENLNTTFAFTGLDHRASGLYFALYRQLDPRPGRWLSRDPLGKTQESTFMRTLEIIP